MSAIWLASLSPRRRELLAGLGFRFEALDSEVDETRAAGEPPVRYVERMAEAKARAGLDAVSAGGCGSDDGGVAVLGADTIVVVGGEVLGKPRDGEEVLAHLALLSGRSHEVMTAVALARREAGVELRLSRSRVWFRSIAMEERLRYRSTGEPADKAGSYAVQGFAAAFVTRIEGSWSGVVGLPLHETTELLARAGHPLPLGAKDDTQAR